MSTKLSGRAQGTASRAAFVATMGELLRRQGYSATGISELVSLSGAPKGSLYFHFPGGKQELALAAMEQTGEELRGAIAAVMSGDRGTGAAIAMLLDALAAGLEASGYRDGCPIATITLEAAAGSEPVRATADRVFSAWLSELETAMIAEGLDRSVARRRALLVLAAIEGGLILARARRETGPLVAVREELLELMA
ncbi:MAG: TetR/AcrR family transcriptional regulator [Solirubrobacteraceae bacterium]